jgi:hypothetical protein
MTNGYGQTRVRRDNRWCGAGAHQVAYYVATGRWERQADGRLVRHLCHNRLCCNPAHLVGGTPAENADDRVARRDGRSLLPPRNLLLGNFFPGYKGPAAALTAWRDLQASASHAARALDDSELVTRLHRKLSAARDCPVPDLSPLGLCITRDFRRVAWRWACEPMRAERAAQAAGLIALADLMDDVLHLQEHGDPSVFAANTDAGHPAFLRGEAA